MNILGGCGVIRGASRSLATFASAGLREIHIVRHFWSDRCDRRSDAANTSGHRHPRLHCTDLRN